MSVTGSDDQDGGSRRSAARQRVLLTGVVAYPDLSASFRCTIRERSDAGARIKVPDVQIVPARIWLIEVSAALAHDASIAWRRAPELGLTFAPPPVNLRRPGDDSLHRRLRALWLEVAPRSSD
jgi:hypothetical protein